MAEVAASVEIVPSKGDADGSRLKEYEAMYQYSITRPEEFWAKVRRPFLSLTRSFFRGRVSAAPLAAPKSLAAEPRWHIAWQPSHKCSGALRWIALGCLRCTG
jgi:hypothetical protein